MSLTPPPLENSTQGHLEETYVNLHGKFSSGTLNYGHHSSGLIDVTMDDTSHSVYLAGGDWSGFSEKTSDGGSCYGDFIRLYGACNALDQTVGGSNRIKCVRKS